MKFDELDERMRVFETAHDHSVLPHLFMVARLDGRNFTRLTKEIHQFDTPFDERFRNYMVETVKHLMDCGFRIVYGYTESDEISLLFHPKESTFSRKLRKYNSILSGEASAKLSLQLGDIACMDCRISQLPRVSDVVDYFRWRNEDAFRNALSAHCYWVLRKNGRSAQQATATINGLSIAEKNELLFENKINFNDLPNWQKRGVGVFWEEYVKKGWNPKLEQEEHSLRKRIKVEYDLPMKDDYSRYILEIVEKAVETA